MGGRPVPLWKYGRRGPGDEPIAPRVLDGDWRDEFALVYEAAAARGFRPRDCDEMEIWELASALGGNAPDDADPLVDDAGLSWNARRATALARGEPEPQWDDVPLTAKEVADMERLSQFAQVIVPPADPG